MPVDIYYFMKSYIKAFYPQFRPIVGSDFSFNLRWLEEQEYDLPLASKVSGVYIISSTDGTKYIYPNGKRSPILYIGQSSDLRNRLQEHFRGLQCLLRDCDYGLADDIQIAPRYQYMYYNGSYVDVFKCRKSQESKDLESIILNQFYKTYRALPVGNAARSFCKYI